MVGRFSTDGDLAYGDVIGKANLIGPIGLEFDVLRTSRAYTGFATSLDTTSLMVDAVYRSDAVMGPIGVYLGGSVGMINVKYDEKAAFPVATGNDGRFGWQAMAGLEAGIPNTGAGVFAEWRYQSASDATIQGIPNIEYSAHTVMGGLRFSF